MRCNVSLTNPDEFHMINLPSYDIGSISSPEQGLEMIRNNLIALKQIALETDFAQKESKENFYRNLSFIKQYYERVDYLLAMEGR
jgi:hypothetical protein